MTRERLRQFISDNLGTDIDAYDDDALLFTDGVLDSLGLLDIIGLFESEGGFKVGATEVALSNFDSINRMLAYAQRKQGK